MRHPLAIGFALLALGWPNAHVAGQAGDAAARPLLKKAMDTTRNLMAVVLSACVSTGIGCATPSEAPGGGEWITARVVAVRRATEPYMAESMDCVGHAAHDDSSYVVTMRYRSAHMLRDRSFVVPSADTVHVGDVVSINTQQCVLKQLPARCGARVDDGVVLATRQAPSLSSTPRVAVSSLGRRDRRTEGRG